MAESFTRIEKAFLQEKVNKYFPGTAPFYIPAITPSSIDNTVIVSKGGSMNKNATSGTSKIQTSKCITLQIPKDIVRDYKEKMIPVGTCFLVAFIGGNNTVPKIIGMEW